MARLGPKSVRGRITLLVGIATAIAMALIVVAMGLFTRTILENAIADSLHERLDQARDAVAAGEYDLVIDLAGNEVIQVIDENGDVVAGSRNARGLASIAETGESDKSEVDDLEFKRDTEEASGDPGASNGGYVESPAAPVPVPVPVPIDDSASGDADGSDSDDDTDDDDADDDDTDDDDDVDDDDADSDDDDDDDNAKRASASASGKAHASVRPAWVPFSHGVAWADEPVDAAGDPAATIDAASVLGSEGPYLILKDQVDSPDGRMTVVAVTSLAQAARSAAQTMWLLAAIMAAVLAAVIVLTWLLTGHTLQPVEQMRREAASISADNLGSRIEVPHGDRDLAPLAETLNEMLARIERSLEEEKRFISDASHELKSPIAATSIILDSLRAHPEGADVPRAIDDLTSENERMASVVGDMLALTRYDEGRLNCSPEPIDLMDIVLEEAMALKARSAVEVDLSDVQPLTCRADADLLRHVLRNLLDNAARYAESLVKVSCETAESSVVIRVSDDGPGIAPGDRERVFGRFVCLDERSGTGLGLPVARTIVDAHGGTLVFCDPVLSGATAKVTLPA
ncbi:MAG: HAMP domain-containing histidine kinase [Eggerthellaceae bacterium]|nr:HAMP domain-containing histidine kinase [Eggerthellaceae bacterium]